MVLVAITVILPVLMAATSRASAEGEGEGAEETITSAPPFGDDALLEGLAPEGWGLGSPIEHYNVATLYNKINGRSELYMAYDVKGLSWATFVTESESGRFVDVFAYDMRSVSGAFGSYAVEREMDQPPAGLGRDSYRTGANHYFWKGNWYMYVQSSHDDDLGRQTAYALAKALADRIPDSGEEVMGLDWLPQDEILSDSVMYFKADAMSLDFMTHTFMARYKTDQGLVTGFVSKRESASDAESIRAAYGKYMEEYGVSATTETIDGVEMIVGNLGGGYHDIVFVIDTRIAGISSVRGRDTAVTAARSFLAKLKSL